MRFIFIFLFLASYPFYLSGQENVAIADLLKEAKTNLYSQPQQSGKIAEYVVSQNESSLVNAEASLLLAKSFYVRGNFNQAVLNALEAKKYAIASDNTEKKIKTTLFNIALFRMLNLESVAGSFLNEMPIYTEKIEDENLGIWMKAMLILDSAKIKLTTENFSEAHKLLTTAKASFQKMGDSAAVFTANIALSEFYLKTDQEDSAKLLLEKMLAGLHKKPNSDFQKLQVLNGLGAVYFSEKNYVKSLELYQNALAVAANISNNYFKNKSLEGMAVNYLALEDAENFYTTKQRINNTSSEVQTDRTLAINSVYNFINTSGKEQSKQQLRRGYFWIYIWAGIFFLLLIVGVFVNYLFVSKTKEYVAIWKYIQPKKPQPETKQLKPNIEKSTSVPSEIEQALLLKLNTFEAGKKYTNPDMSIALLAAKFDTNTKYLSEVINRQKGKNFNSYINELRINYIIEKLKTDSVYFNYKVSYLAEESGFSSHSSFATVFKSVTGISPTKFMDFLQKRKETA